MMDQSGTLTPSRQQPSQSELVYELMREKIAMMELAPGERLNEVALVEQLGVGRTPFREAIQRLVQHGLVISKPYQSATVAPLQAFEISQIVEVRSVLELASVRFAAERATARDKQAIAAANLVYNQSVDGNDGRAIIKADAALHDAIAEASHNTHLRHAIAWNRDYGCRLWCLAVDRGDQFNTKKNAHDKIVAAINKGDADAAAAEMQAHIGLFRTKLQRVLNGEEPEPPRPRRRGHKAD